MCFESDAETRFPTSSSIPKPHSKWFGANDGYDAKEGRLLSRPYRISPLVWPTSYSACLVRRWWFVLRLLTTVGLVPGSHLLALLRCQHCFYLLVGVAMDGLDFRLLLVGV